MTDIRFGYSLSVVIFHMMVNSCCANGVDVQMRGFFDSLILSASLRIRTAYSTGEMWTGALIGRENWTPILVIWGVVTIRHFISSSYVTIMFIRIFLRIKMECCYCVILYTFMYDKYMTSRATSYIYLL